MPDDSEQLRVELSDARAEILRLRQEVTRLESILGAFSIKRASGLPVPILEKPPLSAPKPCAPVHTAQLSADNRVRIFRSLFRGRDDVYAVRWENKQGKSGYSPACAHEWDPTICRKPGGKCTHCSYLPLTDEAVRSHLLGQKTIGVYPLLKDETCRFLVADFDKEGWKDDATAYLIACEDAGVAAYLERSRSGNGGHVWHFFDEALPAAMARKLGSTLLTAAMDKRHRIGLGSYDRLFPNQDTLPKGGFGNLIALPLQRSPRDRGNSVFLDDNFVPWPDQWEGLEGVLKIGRALLDRIVRDAERRNLVVGIRLPAMNEEAEEDPWALPPSRKTPEPLATGPFPASVTIVRSNMLYIEKEGLGPALMNRIVRLAAFQNPEFHAAQAMRLSTFGKPRIIGCAEEFPRHVAVPRGCLMALEALLSLHGIAADIRDERCAGTPQDLHFLGNLTPGQQEVIEQLSRHEDGVVAAPPGFGKTVVAARMIAHRQTSALILVHRAALLRQWRDQLSRFLDLDKKLIGLIGGGKNSATGNIDIAMMQSLQRKGEVSDAIAGYGHIVVDECHHLSAFTFERIMKASKAKYVLGLTATPIRKDGHHPIIFMQCGPIRHRVHARQSCALRPFGHRVLARDTAFSIAVEEPSIQQIYAGLVRDSGRNKLILSDILSVVAEGRVPIVLTERVEHVEILQALLCARNLRVVTLRGGMGKAKREEAESRLAANGEQFPDVLIATGRYAGEGFDCSRLDTLFLAMPVSWRGTLEQYVGRLHRLHEEKREVRVYDYVDQHVPMLARMYGKRVRGYRAMGYQIETDTRQLSLSPGKSANRDNNEPMLLTEHQNSGSAGDI